MNSILIKNGLVCFEDGVRRGDVFIRREKISSSFAGSAADEIINADGCYVMPGMIDIHTHLYDKIGNYNLADGYEAGTKIAVLNGITSLYNFVTQGRNETLKDSIEKARVKAKGKSYCDYGWHLTPTAAGEEKYKEAEEAIENGFKTFKFYTTYRNAGLYTSYNELEKVFAGLGKHDITFLMHCEDNGIIEAESEKEFDFTKPFTHTLLRPKQAEIKAIGNVINAAMKYNARLHIVHVSTAEGAELINKAKGKMRITCETAPHYLFLNNDLLKKENGHGWICSPPLRDKENTKEMTEKAKQGYFDIFATDHCAFLKRDKDNGFFSKVPDIRKVPNGIAGIGALPHLTFKLYSDNFRNGIFELSRRLSVNPAKITGIYPKKGVIREGSDADLVILNASGEEREIKSSLSDVYETYPRKKTKLNFKYVIVRGNVIVKDNRITNEKNFAGECIIKS